MKSDEFNAFCGSLRATTYVIQWGGSHVWKVGGKVFAIAGEREGKLSVTFKVSYIAYELRHEMDPALRETRAVRCEAPRLYPSIAHYCLARFVPEEPDQARA